MLWPQATINFGNPWPWEFVFMAIPWESVITIFWCEVITFQFLQPGNITEPPRWGIERDKIIFNYVLEYSCVLENVGLGLQKH